MNLLEMLRGVQGDESAISPLSPTVLLEDADLTFGKLIGRRADTQLQSASNLHSVAVHGNGTVHASQSPFRAKLPKGDILFIPQTGAWQLVTALQTHTVSMPAAPLSVAAQRAFHPVRLGRGYGDLPRQYFFVTPTAPEPSVFTNYDFTSMTGWTVISGTWDISEGTYLRAVSGSPAYIRSPDFSNTTTKVNVALYNVWVNCDGDLQTDGADPYLTVEVWLGSTLHHTATFKAIPIDAGFGGHYGFFVSVPTGSGRHIRIKTNVRNLLVDAAHVWQDANAEITETLMPWVLFGEQGFELGFKVGANHSPAQMVYCYPDSVPIADVTGFGAILMTSPHNDFRVMTLSGTEKLKAYRDHWRLAPNWRVDELPDSAVFGFTCLVPTANERKEILIYRKAQFLGLGGNGDEVARAFVVTTLKYLEDYEVESLPSAVVTAYTDTDFVAVRAQIPAQSGASKARLYEVTESGLLLQDEVAVPSSSQPSVVVMRTQPAGARLDVVSIPSVVLPNGPAAVWGERLVVADTASGLVQVSAEGDPLCFGEVPAVDSDPFMLRLPGVVRALAVDGPALLIYTTDGVYAVNGNSALAISAQKVAPHVAVAGRAADGAVYVGARGVFALDGRWLWTTLDALSTAVIRQFGNITVFGVGDALWLYLGEAGWVKWVVDGVVRDIDYDGTYFVVCTSTGIHRIANGASRRAARWRTGKVLTASPKLRFKHAVWYGEGATSLGTLKVLSEHGQSTTQMTGTVNYAELAMPGGILPRMVQFELETAPSASVYACEVTVVGGVEHGIARAI